MTEVHDAAEQWIILPGTTIGGEVGTFSVDFVIRNRNGSQARTLNGVVDTGASFTVIPAQILDELGIEREETKVFSLADGSRRELPIAWAEMELQGQRGFVYVIFGPDSRKILLGSISFGNLRLGRRRQVSPLDSRRTYHIAKEDNRAQSHWRPGRCRIPEGSGR